VGMSGVLTLVHGWMMRWLPLLLPPVLWSGLVLCVKMPLTDARAAEEFAAASSPAAFTGWSERLPLKTAGQGQADVDVQHSSPLSEEASPAGSGVIVNASHYASIQAALDSAPANASIILTRDAALKTGLVLAGSRSLVCSGSPVLTADSAVVMLTVTGTHQTVSGCTFNRRAGGGEIIKLVAAKTVSVYHNTLSNSGQGYTIKVIGGSGIAVYANRFTLDQAAGIGVTDSASRVTVSDNEIEGTPNGTSDSVISVASLRSDPDYCRNIKFTGNRIQNVLIGLQANGVDGLTINDNTVIGTSQDGIQVAQDGSYATRPNLHVTVMHNIVKDANAFKRTSDFSGIHVTSSEVAYQNRHVRLIGNSIERPFWDAIFLERSGDVQVTGNTITGPNFSSSGGGNCIEAAGITRLSVDSNHCSSFWQSGIDISAAGTSLVTITGNTLYDMNRAGRSYKGIVCFVQGCRVSKNSITLGAHPLGRSIDVSGAADTVTDANNIPETNGGGGR
jgi:parallel beta helix pectate lyase-like protein